MKRSKINLKKLVNCFEDNKNIDITSLNNKSYPKLNVGNSTANSSIFKKHNKRYNNTYEPEIERSPNIHKSKHNLSVTSQRSDNIRPPRNPNNVSYFIPVTHERKDVSNKKKQNETSNFFPIINKNKSTYDLSSTITAVNFNKEQALNKSCSSSKGMKQNNFTNPRLTDSSNIFNLATKYNGLNSQSQSRLFRGIEISSDFNTSYMGYGMNSSMFSFNTGNQSDCEYIRQYKLAKKLEKKKDNQFSEAFLKDKTEDVSRFNSSVNFLDKRSEKVFEDLYQQKKLIQIKGKQFHIEPEKNDKIKDLGENDPNIAVYKILEGQPKCINFYNKNFMYLYIETYARYFPCHVVNDIKDTNFEFFCKFVNLEELVNFHEDTNRQMYKDKLVDQAAKKNLVKANLKKVDFSNFIKPNMMDHDFRIAGDIVDIEHITKKGEVPKKVHFLVILVKAPRQNIRGSFSISFTNPKYMELKDNKYVDLFGDDHKRKLYNLPPEVNFDDPGFIMAKTQYVQKEKHIVIKNHQMANFYKVCKQNNLLNNSNDLKLKTQNALFKHREKRIEDLQRKKDFSLKHDLLKVKNILELSEKVRLIKLYYRNFFWRVVINFYQKMDMFKYLLVEKKDMMEELGTKNKMAVKIQRAYRRHYSRGSCVCKTKVRIFETLMFRAKVVKYRIYSDVKYIIRKFCRKMVDPWKLKTKVTAYCGYIRGIQRNFRRHMSVKQKTKEMLDSWWQKQVIYCVDNENYFRELGIQVKLDNLTMISSKIKDQIFEYLVNIQLLRYVDSKFEKIVKDTDKKTAHKAKILSTKSSHNMAVDHYSIQSAESSTKNVQCPKNIYLQIPGVAAPISTKSKKYIATTENSRRKSQFSNLQEQTIDDKTSENINQISTIIKGLETQEEQVKSDLVNEYNDRLNKRLIIRSTRLINIIKEMPKDQAEKSIRYLFNPTTEHWAFNVSCMWEAAEKNPVFKQIEHTIKKIREMKKLEDEYIALRTPKHGDSNYSNSTSKKISNFKNPPKSKFEKKVTEVAKKQNFTQHLDITKNLTGGINLKIINSEDNIDSVSDCSDVSVKEKLYNNFFKGSKSAFFPDIVLSHGLTLDIDPKIFRALVVTTLDNVTKNGLEFS